MPGNGRCRFWRRRSGAGARDRNGFRQRTASAAREWEWREACLLLDKRRRRAPRDASPIGDRPSTQPRSSSFLALPVPLALLTLLAACGGGGGNDAGDERSGAPSTSDVAVRFSDAPVDAAARVVVTVDSMTFRPADGEDIVVERFTSDELGIDDADTFTIDLLAVQGDENRLVLDSVELPVGSYDELRLGIVEEDVNFSFVEEVAGGALRPIKVPSGELKLGAFEVSPLSTQTFVVEFGLRQSMTYNPGPERYILKPRGVRVVTLEQAAAIEGRVDLEALHLAAPCDAKPDTTLGNAVYLYGGHRLDAAALADDFDVEVVGQAGAGRVAPLASAVLGSDGEFLFSYLEPGNYTLAASCAAADDDPDRFDAIVVPEPTSQRVETSVARGERSRCALGGEVPDCASVDKAAGTWR